MISPNTTGLDVKYNGYIVLAPSPHCAGKPTPVPTGKFYKWLPGKDPFENDFLMPYLPAWIVARTDLGKLAMVGVRQSDDDIYGTGKCGLGIKHIRGLLAEYSSDIGYDDWLAILQGVHHETDASAEGEEFAREWSAATPSRYDPEEFDKKWRSFGKGGQTPLTIRRLIRLAGPAQGSVAFIEFETRLEACEANKSLGKCAMTSNKLSWMTLGAISDLSANGPSLDAGAGKKVVWFSSE